MRSLKISFETYYKHDFVTKLPPLGSYLLSDTGLVVGGGGGGLISKCRFYIKSRSRCLLGVEGG